MTHDVLSTEDDNTVHKNNLKEIENKIDIIEEVTEQLFKEDTLLPTISAIQDGIHVLDNNDGTMTSVTYKDGKKSGLCQILQGNNILMEMTFINDVLTGTFKYYLANKSVQTLMNYVNDKLHGDFFQYYADGKSIQMKTTYKEGLQNGISQSFDQDGNLVQEMTFKDGNLDGPMNTYYNNELIARTYYKDGAEVMQKKSETANYS